MAMTRRRYVTPETFTKEDLLALPPIVRLTETGLRLYADDEGRERVNPLLMRAALYPLNPEVTESDIEGHLLNLDDAGVITIYDAGGRSYFSMVDWPTVDRPARSQHPAPPPLDPLANASRIPRESFVAGEREREGGREGDGESGEGGSSRPAREGVAPSPFCRAHPEGTDNPCRGCGTARLRHRQWTDQQMTGARESVRFDED